MICLLSITLLLCISMFIFWILKSFLLRETETGMESQPSRPNNGTVVPLLKKGEKLVLHPGAISYHLSEKHTSKECREGDYSQCGVSYDEFDLAQL